VLAHSTWHLYRKVVEPDLSPRQDYDRTASPDRKGRWVTRRGDKCVHSTCRG
jgi:hypothetical protein